MINQTDQQYRSYRKHDPDATGYLASIANPLHYRNRNGLIAGLTLFGLVTTGQVQALELGFEGLASAVMSDNLDLALEGEEITGVTSSFSLAVYGLHKSSRLHAAFHGDFESNLKIRDGEEVDRDTLSEFRGKATFSLTPRALTWFVSDVIGGVLACRDLVTQGQDYDAEVRRNIFATGPVFNYKFRHNDRLTMKAYYVDQSQSDGFKLDDYIVADASYFIDMKTSSRVGFHVSTSYRFDVNRDDEPQHARDSIGFMFQYQRPRFSSILEVGLAQYDNPFYEVNDVYFDWALERQLTSRSLLNVEIKQDIGDQSLHSVNSLTETGLAREDLPEGVSTVTEAAVIYTHNFDNDIIRASFGAQQSRLDFGQFEAQGLTDNQLRQDSDIHYANVSWEHIISSRFSTRASAAYIQENYKHLEEEAEATTLELAGTYRFHPDFSLISSVTFRDNCGIRENVSIQDACLTPFEFKETQYMLAVKWEPPSRVSKDVSIQLKSMLE